MMQPQNSALPISATDEVSFEYEPPSVSSVTPIGEALIGVQTQHFGSGPS
jgi:hypothetical protein